MKKLNTSPQTETNEYQLETNAISNSDFYLFDMVNSSTSAEQLKQYMKDPMIYNQILRAMSRQAYNTNGMYANTIDYSVAIPNLDYITVCRTKNKKK